MRELGRLIIQREPQRFVAREPYFLRYYLLALLPVVGLFEFFTFDGDPETRMLWGILGGALYLFLLARLKAWHFELRVDTAEERYHAETRFLGLIPIRSIRAPISGTRLFVRHEMVEGSEDLGAVGCLALLIPFPFSLIVSFASQDGSDNDRTVADISLRSSGTTRTIARFRDPRDAAAVRDALESFLENTDGDRPGEFGE